MCDPHLADAAQQNQNQRVNGLPVAAEDHFAHFGGLRCECGERAAAEPPLIFCKKSKHYNGNIFFPPDTTVSTAVGGRGSSESSVVENV